MIIIPVFAAIYGLILGSFFNVLICRIPEKQSIFRPGSRCPACGTPIRPWHNIPVISYLLLRGKCASCRASISPVYPIIELFTGGAALLLWRFYLPTLTPVTWQTITVFSIRVLLLLLVIPITVIDLRHYIIPDLFTLPLIAISAVIAFLPGAPTPLEALFGLLAGGGLLMGIGAIGSLILKKDAMGGGDIKLMAAAGMLWGARAALLSILAGALLGSVYGLVLLVTRKINDEHQIPFGPFLGAGLWIAVLFGEKLMYSYILFFDGLLGG